MLLKEVRHGNAADVRSIQTPHRARRAVCTSHRIHERKETTETRHAAAAATTAAVGRAAVGIGGAVIRSG
jgi:hypothetical protein